MTNKRYVSERYHTSMSHNHTSTLESPCYRLIETPTSKSAIPKAATVIGIVRNGSDVNAPLGEGKY